jgi:hypothetical protein
MTVWEFVIKTLQLMNKKKIVQEPIKPKRGKNSSELRADANRAAILKIFKRIEFTKHDVSAKLDITEQLSNTYISQLRRLKKVVITAPQNIKICAKYRVASK